jgi:hypothetical protein
MPNGVVSTKLKGSLRINLEEGLENKGVRPTLLTNQVFSLYVGRETGFEDRRRNRGSTTENRVPRGLLPHYLKR